jgi:cation transport protein ChaC
MEQDSAHWVFGYGSLIWRPGFDHIDKSPALLPGAHRRLCIYSYRHRGTEAQPGLVFGLMPGGSCHGMAFSVAADAWPDVLAYLREREMDRGVYREAHRPVRLHTGTIVRALTFVAEANHPQFAGRLTLEDQVRFIRQGVGESGANSDYVLATATHLNALGIRDRNLDRLVKALGTL